MAGSSTPSTSRRETRAGTAGFTDYDPTNAEVFDLVAERRPLPAALERDGSALFVAGTNASDDLFMFLKRRITGLEAEARYRPRIRVEFASDAPSDCVGIGGAPGESVYLKVGAAPAEPRPVPQEDGFLVLGVDKGNQATGGAAAAVIGNVANGDPDCTNPEFRIKVVEGEAPLANADAEGALWVFVGTDSGFEGRTSLFYISIRVILDPM